MRRKKRVKASVIPQVFHPELSPTVAHGPNLSIDLTDASMSPRWDVPTVAEVTEERFRKFQSSLEPHRRHGFVNGFLVGKYITYFDGLVGAYFNRDLARAMATADWAMNAHPDAPASIYLLEDAVMRHCACWDYLFQMLIHFLGVQDDVLPQRQDKDRLASMVMFNLDFIEEHGITHIRTTPKRREEALRAFRAARRRTEFSDKGARGDRFFKRISRKYASCSWITDVKRRLRSSSVKRIHDLRNQIAHARPLSAQTFAEFADMGIPGPALTYRRLSPSSILAMHETLCGAHRELEAALRVCRTAILGYEIPNLKINADIVYIIDTVECSDCGMQTYLPRVSPESTHILCRACGNDDARSISRTASSKAPEPIWRDMVKQAYEDIKKLSAP